MAYQYMDNLPNDAQARYKEKLHLVGLEKCPYKLAWTTWIDNPLQWPPLDVHDLYTYLIQFPAIFSGEAMKNKKSLDAYRFYISGWIKNVVHIKVGHHTVLKAEVRPSYRVTEDPHHPWVALTDTGIVVTAHCDCMAGLGEACSHVGAILYKVEAAVRYGFTTEACTDKACEWNQNFTKNVTGQPASSIQLYPDKTRTKVKSKSKDPFPRATVDDEERLISALAANCGSVSILASYAQFAGPMLPPPEPRPDEKVPLSLRDIFYDPSNQKMTPVEIARLVKEKERKLKISEGTSRYIESVTRAQSSCTVWHTQRTGRITSSVAHSALHTKMDNPAPSLLKKICHPEPLPLNIPAIQWGREHENSGFQLYAKEHHGAKMSPSVISPKGKIHRPLEVNHLGGSLQKSGLVICQDVPYLAASPDGLVTCACCGQGVLEIKCPYNHKKSSLKEMLDDPSFCLDPQLNLKKNSPFYAQVQLQQYVSASLYADLCIWTTQDCVIVRVPRDDDFTVLMLARFRHLWRTAITPELLTRKIENMEESENVPPNPGKVNNDPPSTTSVPLYCTCRTADDQSEDMVCCDRCDEWFHLRCLCLKRLPKSAAWFCPRCRIKRPRK